MRTTYRFEWSDRVKKLMQCANTARTGAGALRVLRGSMGGGGDRDVLEVIK